MSDINVPAAPAADPGAAPATGDSVPRAEFERLQRESQQNRERAQAAERNNPLAGLAPADAQAIGALAQQIAAGNTEAAVAWMIDNAKGLSGGDLSRFISPTAAAPTTAEVADMADGTGLTPTQVRQMIAQAKDEARNEALGALDERTRVQELDRTLLGFGIQPGSPDAAYLLAYAIDKQVRVEDCYQDWVNHRLTSNAELAARVAPGQGGAQPSGGRGYQVPTEGSAKERYAAAVRSFRMGGS